MEPPKVEIKLNAEAMETTKRILVHIIQALHEDDQRETVEHLCDAFGVREYDPYDY